VQQLQRIVLEVLDYAYLQDEGKKLEEAKNGEKKLSRFFVQAMRLLESADCQNQSRLNVIS
jgi:hypothetical protein